ncbi:MAG: hypothetical protein HYT50_00490 [Candidatus Wildermuthbacteria bacterium]|nr:hypothetical protein [Candidatus Wildermuthbacteria bacterium]
MEISILLGGFLGGLIRGLVGFTKYQFSYKEVKFNLWYFLSMTGISGLVGLMVAGAVEKSGFAFLGVAVTPALAVIIGYAGGDFLENLYKIITKSVVRHDS